MTPPVAALRSTVLDSPDPAALARFYQSVIGGRLTVTGEDWVTLRRPDGTGLSFQLEEHHVPPAWPAHDGDQRMQLHLDLATDDLDASQEAAEAAGGRAAPFQPQDDVRVMLDPDGHPFCFFLDVDDDDAEPDGDDEEGAA